MNAPDQQPQLAPASRIEKAATLTAIAASAAPWIGGPIAEVVGGIATDLKIRRVEQFIKDVLAHVEELHSIATEAYVRTEDFIDIFEKTAQIVANERHEHKRALFTRYILHGIANPDIVYDERLKCLQLLQQIDIRHIALVAALLQMPSQAERSMMMSSPSTTILRRASSLRDCLPAIMHETNTLGLTTLRNDYLNVNMTGDGAADLSNNVTTLGTALMDAIR